MKLFTKKHSNVLNCEYTEKEVLCDLIENYIKIANMNNTTLDDYISIIALLNMLKRQYKEYISNFDNYLRMFEKKGLVTEYNNCKTNVPKNIFSENSFKSNIDLAYDQLFDYFNGSTSRFFNYLVLYGLCGKPTTPKQKYIMSKIFEGNSSIFSKQKIYYSVLYDNSKPYFENYGFITKESEQKFIDSINYQKYKNIANGYRNEKNEEKYEENLLKAREYNACANEDLFRFYLIKKDFIKTRECLDLLIEREKQFAAENNMPYKERYNSKIKPLEESYNFKINYPYIRKELLEKYNIDIKTFNQLTKDIKDNREYKLDVGYSKKIIEFLNSKLIE